MANANDDLELLYGMKDVEKISKKKRFLSAFIDFLIFVLFYVLLFYTIGTKCIERYSASYIQNINNEVIRICDANEYPYMKGSDYGIYTLDSSAYLKELKEKDSTLSDDDIAEKCQTALTNLQTKLNESETYKKNYGKFYRNYFLVYTGSIAISLLTFELIIPIFDKKKRTIGMMICKQALVNLKNNELASNVKIMLRFFILFVVENILFRYFLTSFLYIILPLLATIFVVATKPALTLHEILSGTKVIQEQFIGLQEDLPEEEPKNEQKKNGK